MNVAIRPMQAGDIDRVIEMERSSDGASHWSRDIYAQMLEVRGSEAVRKLALIAESDQRIVGFVAGRVLLNEVELENLFVDAKYRRQGIARALLTALTHTSGEAGAEELRLEVREGNEAAQTFYQRAGFVIAGRRRGYYLEPEEDALVLVLKL